MLVRRTHRQGWSSLAAAVIVLGLGAHTTIAVQHGAGRAEPVAAEPTELPREVQKILADAVKAMGGRDAINEIDTMHTRMEMSTEMGTITSEHWWQRPHKSLTKQTIPQMGEIASGTDGEVWWRQMPMVGYQLITEEEADAVGPGGFVAEMIDIEKAMAEQYEGLEALGPAKFDGRECLRVRGDNRERPGSATFFFDAATGLPAGAEVIEEGRRGPETSTMFLRDWKKVNAITLFHTMEFQAGPQKASAKVTVIEFNNVPASRFDLPEEVRKLVSDRTQNTDAGSGKKLEDFNEQQRAMIESVLRGSEQVKDPAALRQMVNNMSRGLDFMPADQKEAMQYAISRIEERIKALGG